MGSIDMSAVNAKNCASLGLLVKSPRVLSDKAANANFILILGGDHCIPMAYTWSDEGRPNTGIVWVDAHADINIPASSQWQHAGIPVSFLGVGRRGKQIPSMSWFKSW